MSDLHELSDAELCDRFGHLSAWFKTHPDHDEDDWYEKVAELVDEAARRLRAPTEWHPASEVPEHEGAYLVVADSVLGQGRLYATAHFNGKWHSYVSHIRAWRDLPEWREPEDAS